MNESVTSNVIPVNMLLLYRQSESTSNQLQSPIVTGAGAAIPCSSMQMTSFATDSALRDLARPPLTHTKLAQQCGEVGIGNSNAAPQPQPNNLPLYETAKEPKIQLPCRSIRFGSYRTIPHRDGFVMFPSCVMLTVKEDLIEPPEQNKSPRQASGFGRAYSFKIGWQNVVKFEFCCRSQLSVIFFTVNEHCAKKIRDAFGLEEQNADDQRLPYFDPNSEKDYHKYLTVVLSDYRTDWVDKIRTYLRKSGSEQGSASDLILLSYSEANMKLSQSVPPIAKLLCCRGAFQLKTDVVTADVRPPDVQQSPPSAKITTATVTLKKSNTVQKSSSANKNGSQNQGSASNSSVGIRKRVSNTYSLTVGNLLKRIRGEEPSCENSSNDSSKNASPVQHVTTERTILDYPAHSSPGQSAQRISWPPDFELMYPISTESRDSISVSAADLACLEPDAFLNDNIIDFYLKYLCYEVVQPIKRSKIHVFNSFFWAKLTSKPTTVVSVTTSGDRSTAEATPAGRLADRRERAAARHKRVRAWTKNVNIFERDYVVIPINENAHWYLAIICHPGADPSNLAKNEDGPLGRKNLKENEISANRIVSNDPLISDDESSVEYLTPNPANQIVRQPCDLNDSGTILGCSSSQENKVVNQNNVASEFNVNNIPGLEGEADDDPDDLAEAAEEQQQLNTFNMDCDDQQTCKKSTKMPCIIIMDSLLWGSPRYKTVGILRDYLTEEYASKHMTPTNNPPPPTYSNSTNTANTSLQIQRIFDRTTCKGVYPKVPQQNNYSDCGIYVLQYAESFLTNPPTDFGAKGLKQMENMFEMDLVKNKRKEILDLLLKFNQEYKKTKNLNNNDNESS